MKMQNTDNVRFIDRIELDNDGVVCTVSRLDGEIDHCLDCNVIAVSAYDLHPSGEIYRRYSIGAEIVIEGYKIPIMIHMDEEEASKLGLFLCVSGENKQ